MKNSKIFKGIITVVTIMILVIMFNEPTNVYAAQDGNAIIEVEKDITLDDSHEIHVSVDIYVEYAYEEGVAGWINYGEVQSNGGVGSDNVSVETLSLEDYGYGSSTYYEKYYFYGYDFWYDYTGYITIYVYCDEWGNIGGWIEYEVA